MRTRSSRGWLAAQSARVSGRDTCHSLQTRRAALGWAAQAAARRSAAAKQRRPATSTRAPLLPPHCCLPTRPTHKKNRVRAAYKLTNFFGVAVPTQSSAMPRKAHKEHQLQPGLSRTEKEQERYKMHPRIYVLEVRCGCGHSSGCCCAFPASAFDCLPHDAPASICAGHGRLIDGRALVAQECLQMGLQCASLHIQAGAGACLFFPTLPAAPAPTQRTSSPARLPPVPPLPYLRSMRRRAAPPATCATARSLRASCALARMCPARSGSAAATGSTGAQAAAATCCQVLCLLVVRCACCCLQHEWLSGRHRFQGCSRWLWFDSHSVRQLLPLGLLSGVAIDSHRHTYPPKPCAQAVRKGRHAVRGGAVC